MKTYDLLDLLSIVGPLDIYVEQEKRKMLGPYTTHKDFSNRQAVWYILGQVANQARARAIGQQPAEWRQPPKAAIQQAVAFARKTYDETLAKSGDILVDAVYADLALQVLLEVQHDTGIESVLDAAVALIPTWGAR